MVLYSCCWCGNSDSPIDGQFVCLFVLCGIFLEMPKIVSNK